MSIIVETSGPGGNEPIRFSVDDRVFDVIETEDRWYDRDRTYFKVFASDAGRYLLRRELTTGVWEATPL
jgi:hypothetical protein